MARKEALEGLAFWRDNSARALGLVALAFLAGCGTPSVPTLPQCDTQPFQTVQVGKEYRLAARRCRGGQESITLSWNESLPNTTRVLYTPQRTTSPKPIYMGEPPSDQLGVYFQLRNGLLTNVHEGYPPSSTNENIRNH